MNEDYLWDKSGEPDPQIQELEEILGSLRYKPTPLALPADLLAPRQRSYRPLLAIAATLLLALLATGVWISLRKSEAPTPELVNNEGGNPRPSTPRATPENKPNKVPNMIEQKVQKQNQALAVNKSRRRSVARATRREPEPEAEVAKEQIMMAMRLASEKFKLASRKTQLPASNQIRNQHKVG